MAPSSSSSGIGFIGALTILFIALKLLGVIEWSWLWVLAPLWVGCVLGVLFLVVFIGGLLFVSYRNS